MRRANWMVLRDPLMISLIVFMIIFIIVVSLASVEPWTIPSGGARGRNTRDVTKIPGPGAGAQCVYTYKAFQPNLDFFQEKVAEITVDKCNGNDQNIKRKKKRQRGKSKKPYNEMSEKNDRGKSKDKKKRKIKNRKRKNRPKTKSRKSGRRNKKKKNKKLFRELKVFRKWKSVRNHNKLMSEPVAQKAVKDLWADLLEKGPHWKDIFEDMHLDHELVEVHSSSAPSTTTIK